MMIIIIMIMIIITEWTKIISQIMVDKMHMAGCIVVRCVTPKNL